jgi:hypothetical protein
MGGNLYAKIMVLVSVIYGMTLAVLGYLGSSALGLTAMIGAMVIALGWVAAGLFGKAPKPSNATGAEE